MHLYEDEEQDLWGGGPYGDEEEDLMKTRKRISEEACVQLDGEDRWGKAVERKITSDQPRRLRYPGTEPMPIIDIKIGKIECRCPPVSGLLFAERAERPRARRESESSEQEYVLFDRSGQAPHPSLHMYSTLPPTTGIPVESLWLGEV